MVVNKNYKLVLLFLVFVGIPALLLAAGCGGTSGPVSSVQQSAQLTSISVTPSTANLSVGSTQQFKATGSYSDGSSKDVSASVTWTSSVSNVAKISSTGMATPMAPGTTTLEASSSSLSGKATLTVPASSLQVKISEVGLDNVITLAATLKAITLINSKTGVQVQGLASAIPVEWRHDEAVPTLASITTVPQGDYDSFAITLAAPSAATESGQATVTLAAASTATTKFQAADLVINQAVGIATFILNLGTSLSGTAPNYVLTPSFVGVPGKFVSDPVQQGENNGELERATGPVVSVNASGNSFTMAPFQTSLQSAMVINVDSPCPPTVDAANCTAFRGGLTGLSGTSPLGSGMVVEIHANTKPDGSFIADLVEARESNTTSPFGMQAEGIITSVTPSSGLELVVAGASCASCTAPSIGSNLTADISGVANTAYEVSSALNTTGAGVTFDAKHLAAGQYVEVDAFTPGTTSITANKIKLQLQAFEGTVNLSSAVVQGTAATFTLNLPADSAFTALTGVSSITVKTTPNTFINNANATIGPGTAIPVTLRGLLFTDGSGNWTILVEGVAGPSGFDNFTT